MPKKNVSLAAQWKRVELSTEVPPPVAFLPVGRPV
ncbi:hypothetical protein MYXA107069_07730 [Myxococcus xanthus]|nr:hypothetical protein MyxoNM_20620 [Myxococcus xanthus]SDW68307.1 hypothetical protein SAMN05444383_103119 [Myxococcus xanthus]